MSALSRSQFTEPPPSQNVGKVPQATPQQFQTIQDAINAIDVATATPTDLLRILTYLQLQRSVKGIPTENRDTGITAQFSVQTPGNPQKLPSIYVPDGFDVTIQADTTNTG